jgi:hypothetical protein
MQNPNIGKQSRLANEVIGLQIFEQGLPLSLKTDFSQPVMRVEARSSEIMRVTTKTQSACCIFSKPPFMVQRILLPRLAVCQ